MRSDKVSLSISIVTYNTEPALLETALHSIARSTLPTRVYVVDNSVTDNLRAVAQRYESIYFHSDINLGFGRGHNLALAEVGDSSKYHLFLNPDVSFGATALKELYDFMELNPAIGWAMPNVLYPDGTRQELCKRLPAPWDLFIRRFVLIHGFDLFAKNQSKFKCRDLDLSKPRYIPNLSGCFAFVRTKIVQAIGGFDKRFFLYLEDTDLVRRVGEISLTVFYPYVNVYHTRGRGSYRNFNLLGRHLRSATQYFYKWGWFLDTRRSQINRSVATEEQKIAVPLQAFTEQNSAWHG